MSPTAVSPQSSARISSAALKVVMAITGTVFIGFVFVHMVGNLKVYLGPDDLNHYAAFLRDLLTPLLPHGWVLWILRIVLTVCLIAHVAGAAILTVRARRCGAPRATRGHRVAWWRSFTSRTMAVSGVVLLAFIIVHLLDLTLGKTGAEFHHPETVSGTTEYFAYQNLVASFARFPVALFYMLAMMVLGAHMLHGAWSVIHDLGISGARTQRVLWIIGTAIAAAVVVGNISIPLAVQMGWLS